MKEILFKLLKYNSNTGIFTWKNNIKYTKIKAGNTAGCYDSKGYIIIRLTINGEKKGYKAHRLAFIFMTGNLPIGVVDHLDGKKDNNKWSNLQDATPSINAKNRRLSTRNTSGTIGVCKITKTGMWRVYSANNKYIKEFKEKKDAIAARKKAELFEGGYGLNHGALS